MQSKNTDCVQIQNKKKLLIYQLVFIGISYFLLFTVLINVFAVNKGSLSYYLLILLIIIIPIIVRFIKHSSFLAILFLSALYLVFFVNIFEIESRLFLGDSARFHFFSFWYYANSISLGFGFPQWFPAEGGFPVGPLSI